MNNKIDQTAEQELKTIDEKINVARENPKNNCICHRIRFDENIDILKSKGYSVSGIAPRKPNGQWANIIIFA